MTKIRGGAKSESKRDREKSLETFEKVSLKRLRSVLKKKPNSRYSIDRKTWLT